MSFVTPASFFGWGWKNGEGVLFCFLCKLIVGLVPASWPRPPSLSNHLPAGRSCRKDRILRTWLWGLGPWEVGRGGGVLGTFGVNVGSTQSMNSSCPASSQPKTLWAQSPISYSLLGLRACVIQILASVQPRPCARPHLCAHYHCQNQSVFWL